MYKKFFGFKEKPFEIAPDPAFVYLSEVHQEALAHLQYAIQEGKGFSVITGEAGTGKTTLVRKLLGNMDGNVQTCYIFNPVMNRVDFLNYICHDLGIDSDGIKSLGQSLTALHNYLLQCFTNDEKVFLIIDEAQSLESDLLHEIRLLTNLETAKYKLLHVILLGQPELNVTLSEPQFRPLKQRIAIRYHLRPLTLKESKEYIIYRLKRAGSKNLRIFDDGAIREIFRYSQGIPRLINIVCDNALLTGFSREQARIGGNIIQSVIRDLEVKETPPWSLKVKIILYVVVILILLVCAAFGLLYFISPDLFHETLRMRNYG
ncbi:MAG TPA: AAA family ATPase [Smithellaceae bacterium]|nr:AAA family ATPase [Smithellaceae bacterium]HRY38332.1 AAA family ATPase [Smithellaceae bacterium]